MHDSYEGSRFLRHFVRDFAEISHPLNVLTRQCALWDNNLNLAFSESKTRFATKPVFAFPRIDEEFIVDVDTRDKEC